MPKNNPLNLFEVTLEEVKATLQDVLNKICLVSENLLVALETDDIDYKNRVLELSIATLVGKSEIPVIKKCMEQGKPYTIDLK